jgi:hypothetical protein
VNSGFKRREKKQELSENEIEAKTETFAEKADTINKNIESSKKNPNAPREIRFTVRLNEYEFKILDDIHRATGLNKVMVTRQALRDYAAKILSKNENDVV